MCAPMARLSLKLASFALAMGWANSQQTPTTVKYWLLQTPADYSTKVRAMGGSAASARVLAADDGVVLWNFTSAPDVEEWQESSDGTARSVGMSTGAFKLQRTAVFQRVVMFSLLNPQPNGAGFVGFYSQRRRLDLSPYQNIRIRCRGQGDNHRYKVYLKHHDQSASGGSGSYESFFQLPADEWTDVTVPLASFRFYRRGQLDEDAPPLDTADVTLFGLQIYGGVYAEHKQKGVASLEIDWIVASK